jgi:hypothetical protein
MTSRDFCYWLQGYFEIACTDKNKEQIAKSLSYEQTECIRNHLNMVFKHEIDPSMGPQLHQDTLSALHQGAIVSGGQTVRC